MAARERHYHFLSMLLSYPSVDFKETVRISIADFSESYPVAAQRLAPFLKFVSESSGRDLEELYTLTFDIQSVCYLDVGYVLFGEDYKRGSFLVQMQKEHRLAGNECGTELPDHLPYILTLLPKITDENFAQELVEVIVLRALDKMLEAFEKGGNVYSHILEAVKEVLKRDYAMMKKQERTLNGGATL
jgi:nitrate reductase molybdenum cofactor assembly chaperone